MDRRRGVPEPRADTGASGRLGRRGEDVAARYLEERGWVVLARNYRAGRKEVDLVVRRERLVAFVEVKSRSTDRFGDPLHAITRRKRGEIAEVARAWRRAHPGSWTELRFDAVGVLFRPGAPPVVTHVEDAWRLH